MQLGKGVMSLKTASYTCKIVHDSGIQAERLFMIQEYKQTYQDTSVPKQRVCNRGEVQKGSTGGGSRI